MWGLVVADFHSEYGIRLESESMPWRQLMVRIEGLMAADTRIARHFTAKDGGE